MSTNSAQPPDHEYGWIGTFTSDGSFYDSPHDGYTRQDAEARIQQMQADEDKFEDGDTHITYVLASRPKQRNWAPVNDTDTDR